MGFILTLRRCYLKPKKNEVYERLLGKNAGSYIRVTKVHNRKTAKESYCEVQAVYMDAWPNKPDRFRRAGTIKFGSFSKSNYRQLTKAQINALESAGTVPIAEEESKKIEKFASSRDRALLQAYVDTPKAHKEAKAKNIFDKVIKYGAFASRKQRGFFYRLLKDAGADLTAYGKSLNSPEPGEEDNQILEAIQAQNEVLQRVLDRLDNIAMRLPPLHQPQPEIKTQVATSLTNSPV